MVKSPGRPVEINTAQPLNLLIDKETKDVLKAIAQREGKSVGELLRPVIEDYAKAHAEGNNQFMLTSWNAVPEFMGLPTMGEVLKPDRLGKLNDLDFSELAHAARGRAQEVNGEIKRRGMSYGFDWGLVDQKRDPILLASISDPDEQVERVE